nr:thymidylate synthase [uncultured Deefgea sp.]
MKQYLNLVQEIFDNGSWQKNRTGVRTRSLPGAMMKFDLQDGFPAISTKKLAFKTAIGEMVGFLRGYRNAADFRALGCKVWDQNANENEQWLENPYRIDTDDLGPVYGVQWRNWPAYKIINSDSPNSKEQISHAMSNGYRQIGMLKNQNDSDNSNSVVLYKSIDQLRYCLDTIVNDPGSRRILFHGWNWSQLEEMALPPCHPIVST